MSPSKYMEDIYSDTDQQRDIDHCGVITFYTCQVDWRP